MSEAPKSGTKVSTALELRAWGQAAMLRLDELSVGTPETGPIHRGLSLQIPSHRAVKVDIVEPPTNKPYPVLVFVHGGGWVMGNLDSHYQIARRLAEQGFLVVAVEYGLAPEEAFPAGYDDVVATIRWAIDNIAQYGGDPGRLVLAGDSAGANIVAGIAVSEPNLPVRAVALVYGVYDFENMPTTPEVHADDFLTNLHQAYLGPTGQHLLRDPRVSPIHAASNMPPALVMVGSNDPLAVQSEELAQALTAAGIKHKHVVLPEYPHAFMHMEKLPETLPAFETIAAFLREELDLAATRGS